MWVLDRRGGEARQLTDVKEDLEGYRWSPDSRQLLLTLRVKDEPRSLRKARSRQIQNLSLSDRFHFKEDVEGYLTEKKPHLYLFEIETKKLSKLMWACSRKGQADRREV